MLSTYAYMRTQISLKSTSGVFLGLAGPNTFFPLSAKAARQTSVSHSTVEAEIVAANTGIRTIGLPAMDLFENSPWQARVDDSDGGQRVYFPNH